MLPPSWNSSVNSFACRISASWRVAAKAPAVREANDRISGWSSSEAVLMGWPEVETSARKERRAGSWLREDGIAAVELTIGDYKASALDHWRLPGVTAVGVGSCIMPAGHTVASVSHAQSHAQRRARELTQNHSRRAWNRRSMSVASTPADRDSPFSEHLGLIASSSLARGPARGGCLPGPPRSDRQHSQPPSNLCAGPVNRKVGLPRFDRHIHYAA